MNFFSFDLRKVLLGLFLAAIPLVLVNIDKNPDDMPWYKIPIFYTAGLIERSYAGFSDAVKDTTSTYLNLISLRRDSEQTRAENQRLKVELQRLDELRIENSRMRDLLEFKRLSRMELLPAQVIGRDLSADHSTVIINKGTKHGLKKLHAVVAINGVVGYILQANESTAQVLLLTDRAASVDAIVQRTRARGIATGRNPSSCRLRYLERADNVRVGDLVVTSGLQGYFPKGFPIGRVVSVRRTEYGISQEAYLEPVIVPSKLEEVFVVKNSRDEDFGSLFGPSPMAGFDRYSGQKSEPTPTPSPTPTPKPTARATPRPRPKASPTPQSTEPATEPQGPQGTP